MKARTNNKARGDKGNPTKTSDRDTMKALDQLREWYRRKHGVRGNRKKST